MNGAYKYYLIYACELSYGGYHGIFDVDLHKCYSYAEAQSIGYDMSVEVIDRYGTLEDYLNDDLTDADIEDIYSNHVEYAIYEVDFNKIGNKAFDELRNEVNSNWKEFRDKYCLEECDEEWK